jgi:hypothetical protein
VHDWHHKWGRVRISHAGVGLREGTRQTASNVREHRKAQNAMVTSSAAFHVQGLSCSYYLSGEAKDIEVDPEESLAISPV